LKLAFKGAYVDFIRHSQPNNVNTGYSSFYTGRDVYFPVTAVGYDLKSDFIDIGLGFAGFKYFIKDSTVLAADTTTTNNANINDTFAYIGYVHGTVKLGGPYVKFNATYQKAPELLGITGGSYFNATGHGISEDRTAAAGGSFSDAFFEGYIEFGIKTGLGTFAANVAYEKNLDAPQGRADRGAVGLNFSIPVVQGFKVTPTVLYINELKDRAGVDQGYDVLGGIKLQYDL
jgi:hypothetical protein